MMFVCKMTRFAMILNAFIARQGADYGIQHSLKSLLYCQYCMGGYPILPKCEGGIYVRGVVQSLCAFRAWLLHTWCGGSARMVHRPCTESFRLWKKREAASIGFAFLNSCRKKVLRMSNKVSMYFNLMGYICTM